MASPTFDDLFGDLLMHDHVAGDISGLEDTYVPYTGATTDVDLGSNDLDANVVTANDTTTGQSTIDRGVVINNSGGSDATCDTTIKTDNYNAINVDASDDNITIMSNASGKIGLFGATPSVQSTGWSVSNVSSDKTYDADSTTIDEIADVLGSLINELKAKGLIG